MSSFFYFMLFYFKTQIEFSHPFRGRMVQHLPLRICKMDLLLTCSSFFTEKKKKLLTKGGALTKPYSFYEVLSLFINIKRKEKPKALCIFYVFTYIFFSFLKEKLMFPLALSHYASYGSKSAKPSNSRICREMHL